MNVIRHTRLAAALGVATLVTLAGCDRRPADVPPPTTTPTPAPEVIPPQPPASSASPAVP